MTTSCARVGFVRTPLMFVLLAYAVYVPSAARRTLVVAALMTVPLLGFIFIAFRAWDPAPYDLQRPHGQEASPVSPNERATLVRLQR